MDSQKLDLPTKKQKMPKFPSKSSLVEKIEGGWVDLTKIDQYNNPIAKDEVSRNNFKDNKLDSKAVPSQSTREIVLPNITSPTSRMRFRDNNTIDTKSSK